MFHLRRSVFTGLLLVLVILGNGGLPGGTEPALTLQQQVIDYATQGLRPRAVAALRITSAGTETAFAGTTGNPTHPTPKADTLFEIGSITKVFTALLLADQVNQGVMTLETPVEELVPGETEDAAAIVPLRTLASHTAGLPRLPLTRILWGLIPNPSRIPPKCFSLETCLGNYISNPIFHRMNCKPAIGQVVTQWNPDGGTCCGWSVRR